MEGIAWSTASTTPRRAGAPRPAVLRDVRQPRHLPQGLERGDQAPHAVGDGQRGACRRSTTTSGSSTTARRTGPRRTTSSKRDARQAARAAAAVADRGDEVQRAAARRPHGRAAQRRHRRPPAARSAATRRCSSAGWAACRSPACSASRTSRSRSPPRSSCRTAAPNGAIIAQGGALRRLELSTPRTARPSSPTTCSASSSSPPRPTQPIPAGKHQVRIEFAYDGGGLAQGRHVSLYYDGRQVGEGRVEATAAVHLLGRRDHRRRLRRRHARLRRHAAPATFTGTSTGSSSTSATTPTTTSSTPSTSCASRCRCSSAAQHRPPCAIDLPRRPAAEPASRLRHERQCRCVVASTAPWTGEPGIERGLAGRLLSQRSGMWSATS